MLNIGPNNAGCVIWACFHCFHPQCHLLGRIEPIDTLKCFLLSKNEKEKLTIRPNDAGHIDQAHSRCLCLACLLFSGPYSINIVIS